MNRIRATVTGIDRRESLHRVTLTGGNHEFTLLTLELGEEYGIGALVEIHFKSAHVSLAKNISGQVSIANRLEATIVSLREGELLAEIVLDSSVGRFFALLTAEAVKRMQLVAGDRVTALLKASDLYLSKAGEL
ncbi:MAG: transporter [Prosthecochloris sp.]|nr:transporter [Prosthecochloris sp.]